MSLKNFFAKFDDIFVNATTETAPRGPIPEGKYVVTISSFTPQKSRAGNPQLVWELEIVDGEHKGRTVKKYSGFSSPEQIGYLKADLIKAGMHLERLSDLATRMGEMFGKMLKVTIKPQHDKGYRVYIEGLAEENMPAGEIKNNNPFADDGQPIDISDDDLPF
jgi:Protein of unknown function (DUF669)